MTKFTHEGKLSNTFDGAAKFGRNLGIDCYGEFVYICDSTFQKIHVIDLNLRYITHFGSGNVKFPGDISIHSDRIYILSLSVSSIYSFNKDYTFLKEIELSGGEKPMTVAMFMVIDPKGNFLISDGSNQEVRIFSPQGMLKHIIGRGHFIVLNGLTLDNSNNIICLAHSTGSDCFQKY